MWKQIGNFRGLNFRCAYFWDTAHGVMAGDNHIFRYTSGTWTESSYPETPAIFRSLRLLDGKNLYAASGSTCVWESTDSGTSWQKTAATLVNADDIYMGPMGQIQGMNLAGIGMMAGTSFATLNGTVCAVARDDSSSMLYSDNGGLTWTASPTQYIISGYCCVADTCAGIFYSISDGLKYMMRKSTDGGRDWTSVHDFVTSGTDILDGGNFGILYAQGDLDVFRSVDGGYTWNSLGRPKLSGGDKRMFAFGPYDNYLLSMNGGEVWLWSALSHALPWPNPLMLSDTIVDGCYPPTHDTLSIGRWPPGIDSLVLWADRDGGAILYPDTIKLSNTIPYKPIVFKISIPRGQKRATFPIHLSTQFYCQNIQWDTSLSILLSPPPMIFAADSISMLTCSDTEIPIRIIAPSCDTFTINSVTCNDPSGMFVVNNSWNATVLPGQRNTVWIGIHGLTSGSFAMPIHLTVTSNGTGLPFDTVITLFAKMSTRRAAPRISVTTNFRVSNCINSLVPIYVTVHPCADLIVQKTSLTTSPGITYSKDFSLPATVMAGTTDTFFFLFPSQGLNGTYTFYARFSGVYADTPIVFDTSFTLRVSFVTSNGVLATNAGAVDLDTISVCSQTDTLVTFTNLGCDSITVTGDQTVWQAGWNADDPAFPLVLWPDSSFTVRVHFQPSAPLWSEQRLSYDFNYIGGSGRASLPFAMTVTVVPAPASLSLSDTALDFGTFTRCDASADTSITLTNSGCDSLSISGASVGAGAGFTLLDGTDTALGTNESVVYKIHFSGSTAGSFGSVLHVHAVCAHGGNAFDTSISFSATIVPGSHLATLSTHAIDFGTTSICEERDSSITISNTGCEPDTITSAAFLSNQFILSNTLSFPIVLLPGRSAIIPILTSFDTAGHPVDVVDTLDFISNLDSALPPVALSRGVSYPERFSLGLKTEDSAPISAMVPVYVLRQGTIPNSADEVDFDLIYNDDLLSYIDHVEPDIQPGSATVLPNGLTDRSFAMKPVTDRDTIATLEFQSYLTKQNVTPIALANQKFMVGEAVSPPCVASIDSGTSASFTLELAACSDGPIVNALTGLPIDLASMNVSPDALRFTLDRSDASITSCSSEILNVLGARALSKTFELGAVTSETLDLRALPAGAYFLRIVSGRSVITKRFVILK